MQQVMTDTQHVSGIFNEDNAHALLNELEMRNYSSSDVSVLMSENTRKSGIKLDNSNKAPEGATIGGISGGLIGAVVGGMTLLGTILLPGVGLLAAGPVAGAIAGLAAGAGAGGLLGGLIGMGMPENEAKYYEDALKQDGNIMISVQAPKEEVPEVKSIFERFNVKNLHVQK